MNEYDPLQYFGSQVSFGAVSGWAAGYALRQGGKVFGVLLGGGFIVLQTLSHSGYIIVDWKKIEHDYNSVVNYSSDDNGNTNQVHLALRNASEFLRHNLPTGSCFTGGFTYGLTGSLKLALLGTVGYGGISSATFGNDALNLLSVNNVQRMLDGDTDLVRLIVCKLMNTVPMSQAQSTDCHLRKVLESRLNNCTIEDLRHLEFEVKNGTRLSMDMLGIQTDFIDNSDLLKIIESAKTKLENHH